MSTAYYIIKCDYATESSVKHEFTFLLNKQEFEIFQHKMNNRPKSKRNNLESNTYTSCFYKWIKFGEEFDAELQLHSTLKISKKTYEELMPMFLRNTNSILKQLKLKIDYTDEDLCEIYEKHSNSIDNIFGCKHLNTNIINQLKEDNKYIIECRVSEPPDRHLLHVQIFDVNEEEFVLSIAYDMNIIIENENSFDSDKFEFVTFKQTKNDMHFMLKEETCTDTHIFTINDHECNDVEIYNKCHQFLATQLDTEIGEVLDTLDCFNEGYFTNNENILKATKITTVDQNFIMIDRLCKKWIKFCNDNNIALSV